ncbi:MAG: hypothetical protein R3D55_25065 [Chloroflexota bacterium]
MRTAVFILLFLSLFLAFFGLRAVLNSIDGWVAEYAFALSCFGAFPISVGVIWVVEKVLKERWPSGRFVTLLADGVSVQTESGSVVTLTQSQNMLPMAWYFDLRGWQRGGRERRVPQNWYCLAVELKAGKEHIIIYTYLPPNRAQRWLDSQLAPTFYQIHPQKVYDNSLRKRIAGPSRPEIPPEIITSKDGSYWLAERRRWIEGFELPEPEFETFMNHIQTNLKL